MPSSLPLLVPLLCLTCVLVAAPLRAQDAPAAGADAHVHVLSRAGAERAGASLGAEWNLETSPRGAAEVLAMLDSAGIRRAVIISSAYQLSAGRREGRGEAAAVVAENDWTAAEALRSPARLVAFCSVNPLRRYAPAEVERCGRALHVRGIKLHLTGAAADLRRGADRARIREVLAVAERAGLVVMIHLRTGRRDYGAGDVRLFLKDVLAATPSLELQVAHLGGWGGYDRATDEALEAIADAVTRGAPGTARLTLDVSAVFLDAAPTEDAEQRAIASDLLLRLAERLRVLDGRVVFGSDSPFYPPAAYLQAMQAALAAYPGLAARIVNTEPAYLDASAGESVTAGGRVMGRD